MYYQRRRLSMRAAFAGAALAAFMVTPSLADYYIVQDSTTKRCRIVEERPAPGVGVQVGPIGFGVRAEAESRMRTVEECRESGATTGGGVRIEERERVIRERQ
jgi:hypothetical protein